MSLPNSDAMRLVLDLVSDGTIEVRNDGTIWRLKEFGRNCQPRRAENPSKKGYLRVTVGVPGQRRTVTVSAHRVVWEALRGVIPTGMQINHKDLNKANNHPENLEVVDQSGNIRHSYANGRVHPWSSCKIWRGRPKLTDRDRQWILKMRSHGLAYSKIVLITGVSKTHIARICKEGR